MNEEYDGLITREEWEGFQKEQCTARLRGLGYEVFTLMNGVRVPGSVPNMAHQCQRLARLTVYQEGGIRIPYEPPNKERL